MRKMMLLVLAVLSITLMSSAWRTDFDRAKTDAKKEHKLILLKFSGSDWCLPCMRMETDVFSKDTFARFAATNLEMVTADFPRLKKNKLDKAVATQNEALADQYNKEGHFPCTLLLDADGKILKEWDGYTGEAPETLIQQITQYVHNH